PEHLKNITPAQAKANANAQAKQRAIERSIRKSKELLHVAKQLGDKELIRQYQSDVRSKQDALNHLVNSNDFLIESKSRSKMFVTDLMKREIVMKKGLINDIIGLQTSDGITIKEISGHLLERIYERGVSESHIATALANPIYIRPDAVDGGRKVSRRYVGTHVTVNINPHTGKIITTWKTGERTRRKYDNQRNVDK
ncbi:TPA: capsid protein, partial [Streptococcus pyogenes NGAS071]|nr:capsid protein [Streptococcus pyogenes]HER4810826.1 capsid protein [Streptococcus pyogenes NGAS071]HEP5525095.1 capsid protein [Streptococcus pyogenes]HEQ0963906.1 capsid protein [Streptococcus pyogenes]HEQ1172733.1 capsid protein [Streptococcus pyogenes]